MTKKESKILKKILPDKKTLVKVSRFTLFKNYLNKKEYWKFNLSSVSKGIAVGLFSAIIPILPFQSLLAILLAILVRGHVPSAFLASWFSNPLTVVPITYLTYYTGQLILHEHATGSLFVPEYHWRHIPANTFITSAFLNFGKSFFVGLPIIAVSAAIIGFLSVQIVWRLVVYLKSIKKK